MLFFIWSKLFFFSVLLFIILDSFSTNSIAITLKNKLRKRVFIIIKYFYIISLPILIAILLRTFLFDIYFVPSSSMERTLFPSNYVLVNKISYGVKVPNHFRNTPVIGSLFKQPQKEYNLYKELPSFKKFIREDIVVFKAVGDSDKLLIKRIIGMPGDTFKIIDSKVFINGKVLQEKKTYTHKYVWKNKNRVRVFKEFSNQEFLELSSLEKSKYQRNIYEKPNFNYPLFPIEKQEVWTRDNYGEIVIPKKGMSIQLSIENIFFYKVLIYKFEGDTINLKNNETITYHFKNNYYFMLGDNRHNSLDSRSFGFVPESYIQGKMIKVFSKKRAFN
ncbi:Signal peptidase I [Polaribacter huanghezhanensis]|nr:Signal peptidase I [Polaribacter huanghezhanensis]